MERLFDKREDDLIMPKLKKRKNLDLYIIAISLVIMTKLILMGLCSSDYEDLMFVPFVKTFLSGHNPYEYYYTNDLIASFPYPPLMLLIESIFGWISIKISSIFFSRLLFKIPLLFFDLVGLHYLGKICDSRKKYLLILYFCSPIVLFSTYMHGQLDIIPTVFLIISLFYLTRNLSAFDAHLSAIFLGLALATKLHILAAIPIVLLYLYKKMGIKDTLIFGIETIAVLFAFIVPFFGDGFINTVIFNKEQSLLMNLVLDYGTAQVLIAIVVIILIYLKAFQLTHINKELLLSITGVMFSVFLMCVSPMPGWFVWIVPFIFIYFSAVYENKYKMLAIYAAFNANYLLYFVFCQKTRYVTLYVGNQSFEFLKIESTNISNIVFSIMIAVLLIIIWNMYQYGLAENTFYKRNSTPFTIGVAGDSGTGKSEFLEKTEDTLGRKKILYIEGDGDHRWERGSSDWEQYTHLDPRANFLHRQAQDISILRAGSMVRRVEYNHDTGTFTEARKIKPKPYIILCGLHPLFLPKSREALDLKIYMDTNEKLRRLWKIKRDTGIRGYSNEKIIEQIEKRIPDAEKYIYPQKEYADLIVEYFDPSLEDCFDIGHEIVIWLKLTMSISVNTEDIITALKKSGIGVIQEYSSDITQQILIIDGRNISFVGDDLAAIAAGVISDYKELFEPSVEWREGIDGILQLVLLKIISETMKGF